MRAPSSGWRFISTICDSVSLVGELRTSGGTFSLPTSCSSAAVPESWTNAALKPSAEASAIDSTATLVMCVTV